MQNLVNFPEVGPDYGDSGEGGLAVFFVLLTPKYPASRQVCCAGHALWPIQDVTLYPKKFRHIEAELAKKAINNENWELQTVPIDLAMLVGSTKKSLYHIKDGEYDNYFVATYRTLTDEGKKLYKMLTQIYGSKPDIVTLLDT